MRKLKCPKCESENIVRKIVGTEYETVCEDCEHYGQTFEFQEIIEPKINMTNINLFGGPGTGKSTTAGGLFYKMKTKGFRVEYIQEYAKELTFGEDQVKLSDQILLLGEQHHRMFRLKDQVDYVIHDSPFIMGMAYASDTLIPLKEYEKLIVALYHRYNHINIFLKRNVEKHGYQEYGRNQTLAEAQQKDEEIKAWLKKYNLPFYEVEMGKESVKEIRKIIKDNNGKK